MLQDIPETEDACVGDPIVEWFRGEGLHLWTTSPDKAEMGIKRVQNIHDFGSAGISAGLTRDEPEGRHAEMAAFLRDPPLRSVVYFQRDIEGTAASWPETLAWRLRGRIRERTPARSSGLTALYLNLLPNDLLAFQPIAKAIHHAVLFLVIRKIGILLKDANLPDCIATDRLAVTLATQPPSAEANIGNVFTFAEDRDANRIHADNRCAHDMQDDLDVVNHEIEDDTDVGTPVGVRRASSHLEEARVVELALQRNQDRIEPFDVSDLKHTGATRRECG
jgi:hypothetical protein